VVVELGVVVPVPAVVVVVVDCGGPVVVVVLDVVVVVAFGARVVVVVDAFCPIVAVVVDVVPEVRDLCFFGTVVVVGAAPELPDAGNAGVWVLTEATGPTGGVRSGDVPPSSADRTELS
jgi:hypothetical protein